MCLYPTFPQIHRHLHQLNRSTGSSLNYQCFYSSLPTQLYYLAEGPITHAGPPFPHAYNLEPHFVYRWFAPLSLVCTSIPAAKTQIWYLVSLSILSCKPFLSTLLKHLQLQHMVSLEALSLDFRSTMLFYITHQFAT